MNFFDQIVNSSEPHRLKAQIILEEDSMGNTVENAIDILQTDGLIPVEYKIVKKDYPKIVHIFLPSEDMRNAIAKLFETGYGKFHGIDRISDAKKMKVRS